MPEIRTVQDQNSLSLSLSNQSFANLIINFLGKKESLEYKENLIFILERNDLEQFYYLLNAKLEREQITLDHFLVKFNFNDNTSREISGISSLSRYLETRDVYPVSVTMTWNIIIKFPQSESIETQTIELTFTTNQQSQDEPTGNVYLLIKCTNLSWGNEVLALFVSKIKNVAKIEPKPSIVARKLLGFTNHRNGALFLYLLSLMTGMTAALTWLVYTTDYLVNMRSQNYLAIAENIVQKDINSQNLSTLIALHQMNHADIKKFASNKIIDPELKSVLENSLKLEDEKRDKKFTFMTVVFFPSILLFLIRYYLKDIISHYGINSYILTTKKSEDRKSTELSNKNAVKHYSLTIVTITIVLSAIGSYLHSMLQ